jgi:class 3 adenylate cyclase
MTFVERVFNMEFQAYKDFRMGIGVDLGEALLTNIGKRGDRELISIGPPANVAAKIQGSSNAIVVSDRVYDVLPPSIQEKLVQGREAHGTKTYILAKQGWRDLFEGIGKEYDIGWHEEASRKRVSKDIANRPLKDIVVRKACTKIRPNDLTLRNSRRADALTIFVDVDGFTNYVAAAKTEDDRKDRVRAFHLLRTELRRLVCSRFRRCANPISGRSNAGSFSHAVWGTREVLQKGFTRSAGVPGID